MRQRYIVPKDKKLKRHRWSWYYSASQVYAAACGVGIAKKDCRPITKNPWKYTNEPCKRCEQ